LKKPFTAMQASTNSATFDHPAGIAGLMGEFAEGDLQAAIQ
jgi:hypothetical protein